MVHSVFKKSSPNEHITLYLRARDFNTSDPIDGVVIFDRSHIKNRKLFCQLVLNYRYGRQKDEVMGLKFYKEFYLSSTQIYPPLEKHKFIHTEIQDNLIDKLGPGKAYPFMIYFPEMCPVSIVLQSGKKGDKYEQLCGIHYYIRIFIAESETHRPHKRNIVKLNIRHTQCGSYQMYMDGQQPHAIISQNFMICSGDVELEASLNKLIFQYGERIPVNIIIRNNSSRIVKKIKITLHQKIEFMSCNTRYTRLLDKCSSKNGCPVQPGATLQTIIYTIPSLFGNEQKHDVAIYTDCKWETAKLAPTTLMNSKNSFGIGVSYVIKVNLILGSLCKVVPVTLPFVLLHQV